VNEYCLLKAVVTVGRRAHEHEIPNASKPKLEMMHIHLFRTTPVTWYAYFKSFVTL